MDALSDVLRAVRLTGAVYFDVTASGTWAVEAPPGATIVGDIFPGAEHLVSYHVVTRGTCWGGLLDAAPLQLSEGDIIVFPHGDPHVMSSGAGMRSTPDAAVYRLPPGTALPMPLTFGPPATDPSTLVCGFLACDARPFNPLLSALPRVIRVGSAQSGALGAFAAFAIAESRHPRPGGDCVLGRVSELMFVDVIRGYLASLPEDRRDWLSGLRDAVVGRALAVLHREPARDWTIESLAREVGASRSALAERFSQFVGQPPMHYLTQWRMQLAAHQLTSGNEGVAEVAERVGYESEAAFSRAFKKVVGVPPGQWRRRREAALAS